MSDYSARRKIMVDTQVRPSDVTKFPIIDAMLSVPRELFVPRAVKESAYIGENCNLTANRIVLEPRTLAKMLDALDIQRNELVLDIGSGLGYSSAVIARMAEAVVALASWYIRVPWYRGQHSMGRLMSLFCKVGSSRSPMECFRN